MLCVNLLMSPLQSGYTNIQENLYISLLLTHIWMIRAGEKE